MTDPATDYVERLWPPPLYWLVAAGVAGTVCWVLAVSTPTLVVVVGTAAAAVLAVAGLVAVGSVEVGVRGGELVAGRAHIPLSMCGAVRALDANSARRARGVEADARAYLVIRPYLLCCVQAEIDDPADPTPYWLVSARHPELIAAAAATGSAGRDQRSTAR
ncbi:MAG: DUF3093 domain-containing protein [Actinomycetota bacterium]|nr:DUF3093 domain-containing protein [Actinomycetota bacterium]